MAGEKWRKITTYTPAQGSHRLGMTGRLISPVFAQQRLMPWRLSKAERSSSSARGARAPGPAGPDDRTAGRARRIREALTRGRRSHSIRGMRERIDDTQAVVVLLVARIFGIHRIAAVPARRGENGAVPPGQPEPLTDRQRRAHHVERDRPNGKTLKGIGEAHGLPCVRAPGAKAGSLERGTPEGLARTKRDPLCRASREPGAACPYLPPRR